jgi:hypothetical protein
VVLKGALLSTTATTHAINQILTERYSGFGSPEGQRAAQTNLEVIVSQLPIGELSSK